MIDLIASVCLLVLIPTITGAAAPSSSNENNNPLIEGFQSWLFQTTSVATTTSKLSYDKAATTTPRCPHRPTRLTGHGSHKKWTTPYHHRHHYQNYHHHLHHHGHEEDDRRRRSRLVLCPFNITSDNAETMRHGGWIVMEEQQQQQQHQQEYHNNRSNDNGQDVFLTTRIVRLEERQPPQQTQQPALKSGATTPTTTTTKTPFLANIKYMSLNHDDDNDEDEESNIIVWNPHDNRTAIPVEGLFGVYPVPSGQIWVWIAQSKPVYNAPPPQPPLQAIARDTNNASPSSWWKIRKVEQMHLLHISTAVTTYNNINNNNSSTILSRAQIQEEARQLALLRQALKEHDWYFCDDDDDDDADNTPNNDTVVNIFVPDMTRNLQSCFTTAILASTQNNDNNSNDKCTFQSSSSSSSSSWWQSVVQEKNDNIDDDDDDDDDDGDNSNNKKKDPERILPNHPNGYPDSRFFWNEGVLEPILKHYQQFSKSAVKNDRDTKICSSAAAAARTLLDWSIPITSAFVGIQRNITLAQKKFNDNDSDNNNNHHHHHHNQAKSNPKKAGSSSSRQYDQLLISRRSKWRAGTRFTKRGADATGNVANYAETEQVVFLLHPADPSACNSNSNDQNYYCRQVCSHVQTRGSIPLRWSSPTDIKTYRPRVRIGTDPLAQARAMKQHLVDQTMRYVVVDNNAMTTARTKTTNIASRNHPSLVLVNLVDKHSDQGRLGRAMDSVLKAILDVYETNEKVQEARQEIVSKADSKGEESSNDDMQKTKGADDDDYDNDNVKDKDGESSCVGEHDLSVEKASDCQHLNSKMIRHEWFDFHAQVKGGRWDRLKSLLAQLQPTLKEQSYFQANFDGRAWGIKRLQTGIIRTNCMDCLDRTNVVQSIFARQMLFAQLKNQCPTTLKVAFRLNPLSLPWVGGEVAHRLLWADNADAISRLYAGTPALKGDFTRTGKRTKKGALDDGLNSIQRYYLNNFLDADRQEGLDLLTRHQAFNLVYGGGGGGDDSEGGDPKSDKKSGNGNSGMTIQDAARKLLLGGSVSSLYPSFTRDDDDDDDDDDDSNHIRAKVKKNRFPNGGAAVKSPNLSWLPGDLQDQMKSLGSRMTENNKSTGDSILWEMDQRAARDLPWWVVADADASSSDEAATVKSGIFVSHDAFGSPPFVENYGTVGNQIGYVVAALVAGARAPLATAAVILGLVSIATNAMPSPLPTPYKADDTDSDDDDDVEN